VTNQVDIQKRMHTHTGLHFTIKCLLGQCFFFL